MTTLTLKEAVKHLGVSESKIRSDPAFFGGYKFSDSPTAPWKFDVEDLELARQRCKENFKPKEIKCRKISTCAKTRDFGSTNSLFKAKSIEEVLGRPVSR